MGGLGLFTAGLLEWVLGNSELYPFFLNELLLIIFTFFFFVAFPFTVFCTFGSFWAAFGFLIQPSQMIAATLGKGSLDYNGGIAVYLTSWAFLVLLYMIASLRV